MLHIILLVLKIIGIILLVLIGLILLLAAVVLFTPFRYQAAGSCKGTLDTLKAEAKVSWLFHLVSGRVVFSHGKLKWKFRAAWLKWSDEADTGIGKKDTDSGNKTDMDEEEFEKEVDRMLEEQFPEENEPAASQKLLEDEKKAKKGSEKEEKNHSKGSEKARTDRKHPEENDQKKLEGECRKQGIISRILARIKNIWEKIKYTFRKLCARIKALAKRKNIVMDFLENKVHKSAFAKAKKELIRLLKMLKPKKFHLKLHFGFEDPSLTGKTLAVLSVVYPFLGEHAEILPEFEESILEGEAFVKGQIRAVYFVITGIRILLDKNIRKTYKDVRKIKM